MVVRTREDLHELIDRLPDSEIPKIAQVLELLQADFDPLARLLRDAPEDDEPLTNEEETELRESEEEYRRGEFVRMEDLARELGI
jgi:hypothetical protein